MIILDCSKAKLNFEEFTPLRITSVNITYPGYTERDGIPAVEAVEPPKPTNYTSSLSTDYCPTVGVVGRYG